jgi:rhodanese-related sulfurtransferase
MKILNDTFPSLIKSLAMSLVMPLAISSAALFSDSVSAGEDEYQSPHEVAGAVSISQLKAKEMYDDGVVFIDVRNPRLYAKGHIPGAVHLDYKYNFDEKTLAETVKKDQVFVIYCSGVACSRSSNASEKAVRWGFSKVHYFRGGIVDWRKAGYETEASE